MKHPKLVVSNQRKEFIHTHWVKKKWLYTFAISTIYIKYAPQTLNSHVSSDTNQCIKKAIHMLEMSEFGILTHYSIGYF